MIKHANPFGLRVPIKMSYRNIKNWIGINNSNRAELMTAWLWSVCFMCNNIGEVCKGIWATNYCLLLEGRCADLYRCLSAAFCLTHCLVKTLTATTCWSAAQHLTEYQTVGCSARHMLWLLKIVIKEKQQLGRIRMVCKRIV